MKKLVVLFFVLYSFSQVFSQHLPLQIGNQWHYEPGLVPSNYYAAIATDTVIINNIKYFKIEYWNPDGSILYWTHYDRIEGDSLYYSYNNGVDNLVFNFNWPDNFIYSTPSIDTNCVDLMLILRNPGQVWGVPTELFTIFGGFYCTGMIDTAWTLSSLTLSKYFGGINAWDGVLVGALIDGTTYGTLYPLPVELLSFSSSVVDNDVTLNWATANETNNSGFSVERKQVLSLQSAVGNEEWKTIGFLNGHGTTTEPQTYFYKNENLSAGKYQYRLKQIDFDGTFEYSNIIESEVFPPAKFSLEQNYPNPFNPTTKISWQSPVNSHQTLKIYDVLGNEVAILVNEYRMAGKYEAEFNASNLSSGIYYYKITAGEFVQTRKMILLK
jgi:hypothetical protein